MSGFIFLPSDQRLLERFTDGMRFSGVWPSVPSLTMKQPALLSAEGEEFEAVALMTRGRKAATYTWHIAFDPVIPFDAPVNIEETLESVGEPTRAAVRATLGDRGGQLPSPLFDDLLRGLLESRPDATGPIERIRTLVDGASALNVRGGEGEPVVLYEGDAVALSLELGGFR